MTKPPTIDTSSCHGQEEEEKYKNIATVNYWWGLRELAAAFNSDMFATQTDAALSVEQKNELDYLQILHYSVYVKLAGAFHQIEQLKRVNGLLLSPGQSVQLLIFELKEAFDALHSDLYQAVCALSNQLFTLLNRSHYKPVKYKKKIQTTGLLLSRITDWLQNNSNSNSNFIQLKSMLDNCNNQLDIRHHAIHYGYIPTLIDIETKNIYIQFDFNIGNILTRFDLKSYKDTGGQLVTILEASETRAKALCGAINAIYEFIYTNDIFEKYMNDKSLKFNGGYKPYWKLTLASHEMSTNTFPLSGSDIK